MAGTDFSVKGIDHVVLRVTDLARSLAFYEGVLGCRLERQQDNIGLYQLRAGDALIDLVPVDGTAGRRGGGAPSKDGRNVDHIALAIRPFDADALRAHLFAHGVAVTGESPDNYGATGDSPALYIHDPDGNMIELMGPGTLDAPSIESRAQHAGAFAGKQTTLDAKPVQTEDVAWIPLREGLSFRPLHFEADGYALQLRVEPGTVIARHRHTGEVHALNISGWRELIYTNERVGPGMYVYEPPGNTDSWRAIGDEPCIIHISTTGRIEYLDDDGNATHHTDTHTAYAAYRDWCRAHDMQPTLSPP